MHNSIRLEKAKGFTLVELLVVVAIIAVLAGVVLLAINPLSLLQKGRDAKRLEDLDALSKAITLALADNEITLTAVAGNTSASDSQAVDGTGYVVYTPVAGKTGLSKFLSTLPVDPTNTDPLVYTYAATVSGYELNAVLESPDNANKMTADGGNDDGAYEIGTSLLIL